MKEEITAKILKLRERKKVLEKAKQQANYRTITLKYEIECKEAAYWEARTDKCRYYDQLVHVRKALADLEEEQNESEATRRGGL
tara:strand:+ start:207 stop:458 length:252 start_codon:yes stop_codon:yes gene_type:complete